MQYTGYAGISLTSTLVNFPHFPTTFRTFANCQFDPETCIASNLTSLLIHTQSLFI